eukprot:Plantae.Rhodophyta-Purpureofilum_apyrenoidigerum.ctg30468.p1 GENE.Plantae.Rhodophyta-Purpureofilum_apyrenoidigerum.ctg30468~~Plantae.Rhodophyta-Purpureofilum_apyrenoidigerum.ctg30468.p1  ORF type:complete len:259 (-),score=46.80 Plantae.Rhodophyta-Purpureofilum_apyrenoidigerum.ctg30468:115-798(-)
MAFVEMIAVTARPAQRRRCATQMRDEAVSEMGRREFILAVSAAVALPMIPRKADANVNLMAAKRSYFRYVPRIEEGVNFYVETLLPAVNDQDWESLSDVYKKTSVAKEGSEKAANDIDPKSTILERLLFVPMKTWSNSFAEKGTSPKSRALLTKEEVFEKAMNKLEKASKGKDANGAKVAWEQGKAALNEYIDIANNGLSRELRKLSAIPDNLSQFKPAERRPDTTF